MNYQDLIKKPRITEKATALSEQGVYVFEVSREATKNEIKKAVKEIYNVMPKRVNIINISSKRIFSMRNRREGFKAGTKKAMIYLKEGDKIEFV